MKDKEEITYFIDEIFNRLDTGKISEKEFDHKIDELILLFPHAIITDMIFHGEKDRTNEEIVDEAFYREHIWRQGGDLALLFHLEKLMQDAVADSAVQGRHRAYAEETLKEIVREINQKRRVRV